MVVWIDQRLDIGTEGLRFGLVFGAWSVGGLAASLALPWLVRRVAAARIALYALPPAAVAGVLVPFVTTWWVAGLALMTWGVFYMLVVINSVTYRQQVTPEHLLGRVNTAGRMLAWGDGLDRRRLLRGRPGGLARPGADARRAVVDRGPRHRRRVDLAPASTGHELDGQVSS